MTNDDKTYIQQDLKVQNNAAVAYRQILNGREVIVV